MAKYIDIFTDYGFKKIFGEEANKHFLIDFLNSLLPPAAHIKDLRFKNNEKLGISPDSRNAVYDIYCENDKGEKFIVELQKVKQKYYLDRTIFYSTFAISEDGRKGEWDWILKPVYCISLLDFRLVDDAARKEDTNVIQRVSLKNEAGREIYHKLTYIYIEMPNFNKEEHELVTRLDQWLFFIKNLESFEAIPEIFKSEIVFVEAIQKAELAKMNVEDRAQYEIDLKEYRNNIANINTAMEDGINKGIEIGEEQGIKIGEANKEKYAEEQRKQEKLNMAKNCIEDGMSIAKTARLTGLTEDELRSIEIEQR